MLETKSNVVCNAEMPRTKKRINWKTRSLMTKKMEENVKEVIKSYGLPEGVSPALYRIIIMWHVLRRMLLP